MGRVYRIGIAVLTVLCLYGSSALAAQTQKGTYEEVVADDFASGTSTRTSYLKQGERRTRVVATNLTAASSGDRVTVTATTEEGPLVGSVKVLDAATEALVDKARKVAVLLIGLPGRNSPLSVEAARERVFTGEGSSNAFFQEESYGAISLRGKLNAEGDVFGPYLAGGPVDVCNYSSWTAQGEDAAEEDGFSRDGYDHLIVVLPQISVCEWAGLGSVGGPNAWINGDRSSGVFSHELGHNLGLPHANGYKCADADGDPVAFGGTCANVEYGDRYDVMGHGSGSRHNNGEYLSRLGILSPSNVGRVTSNGTYDLRSALYPTDETTLLELPFAWSADGTVAQSFLLECREKGGYFENFSDPASTGISIRAQGVAAGKYSGGSIHLIDTHPESGGFGNAPLQPGESFSAAGVTVTAVSGCAQTGQVALKSLSDFGSDHSPPSAPESLLASATTKGVILSWAPSTDNITVTRYLVYRDGSMAGSSSEPSFLDDVATPGDHIYTVYAVDGNANRSAASEPVDAIALDISPPTAPGRPSGTLSPTGVLGLAWNPSMDNAGVTSYRVRQDGVELGTSPDASFAHPGVTGEHAYTIVAEDAAGNRSRPSAALTFPDLKPPLPPGHITGSVTPAGVVNLFWGSSNDNFGVVGYPVFRDGAKIGMGLSTSFRDAAAAPGQHTYVVHAEDAAGNLSAGSDPVALLVPDLNPPFVRGTSPASRSPGAALEAPSSPFGQPRSRGSIAVSWRRGARGRAVYLIRVPAASPVARVELWAGGRLRRTATGSTLSGSLPLNASGRLPAVRIVGLGEDGSVVEVLRPPRRPSFKPS